MPHIALDRLETDEQFYHSFAVDMVPPLCLHIQAFFRVKSAVHNYARTSNTRAIAMLSMKGNHPALQTGERAY